MGKLGNLGITLDSPVSRTLLNQPHSGDVLFVHILIKRQGGIGRIDREGTVVNNGIVSYETNERP